MRGAEGRGSLRQRLRRFWSYCGPGYMIAVGYMDPGNWATDIEAGSRHGYSLLYVILVSNMMAVVLQHLCIRMGIYTRRDLAQNCRLYCPRWLNWGLYVVAEIAIISCDLSEVIGTAIALKLLLGLPIVWGVLVTVLDVLVLLAGFGMDGGRGDAGDKTSVQKASPYRALEFLVMGLMSVVGLCFLAEMFIVHPEWRRVAAGLLVPRCGVLLRDRSALFSALGILGATVMPHNLYLHSAIVQHRLPPTANRATEAEAEADLDELGKSIPGEDALVGAEDSDAEAEAAIRYSTVDAVVALTLALLVNAAILIVAAAAFHAHGHTNVQHIEDAARLLARGLGRGAALFFVLALLAAGQSSTVAGTLAGQIVFEGFLQLRMAPWARRLVTRAVAIVPAVLIILIAGEESINQLLLYSQVILSFQLPFAIVPLILFSFPSKRCTVPKKAGEGWVNLGLWYVSWAAAALIIALNLLFPFLAIFQ